MNYFNYLIIAVFLSFSSLPSLANEPDKPAEQSEGAKEPRFGTYLIQKGVLCKIFAMLPYNHLTVVGGVCRHWHSAKDWFNSAHMGSFKEHFPEAFALYSEEEINAVKNWEEELHLHFEAHKHMEAYLARFGDETTTLHAVIVKLIGSRDAYDTGWHVEKIDDSIAIPLVRLLIAKGAKNRLVLNSDDDVFHCSHGRSALHEACEYGLTKVVALLLKIKPLDLELKTDPDIPSDEEGGTALHVACSYGRFKIVQLLIDAGANINALDWFNCTPVESAVHLHRRAESEREEAKLYQIIDFLLKNGADVRAGGEHLFCRDPHVDVLLLILDKDPNVDFNEQDMKGKTVLHHLCKKFNFRDYPENELDLLEIMFDNSIQVDIKDNKGNTPLSLLIKNERGDRKLYVAAAHMLIQQGADVNHQDKLGRTPLHYVHVEAAAHMLIQQGADVNHQDNLGQTPLHNVRDVTITAILLAAGANVNARDNHGRTPLDYFSSASSWRDKQILALLMAASNDGAYTIYSKEKCIRDLLNVEEFNKDLFNIHEDLFDIDLEVDASGSGKHYLKHANFSFWIALISNQPLALINQMISQNRVSWDPIALRLARRFHPMAEGLLETHLMKKIKLGMGLNEFGKRPRVEAEDERDNLELSPEDREQRQAELLPVLPTQREFDPPNDNNAPDPDEAIPMDIDLPHDNNAPDEAAVLIQGDTATRYFFGLGS